MAEFRVALLGMLGVGKTSLLAQQLGTPITQQHEMNAYNFVRFTTPLTFKKHTFTQTAGNNIHNLVVIDTVGEKQFEHFRPQWINSSLGFVLVYDVTDPMSLYFIEEVVEEIKVAKQYDFLKSDVREKFGLASLPIVLVLNKIDLVQDQFHLKCAVQQAKDMLIKHFLIPETSKRNFVFQIAATSPQMADVHQEIWTSITEQMVEYHSYVQEVLAKNKQVPKHRKRGSNAFLSSVNSTTSTEENLLASSSPQTI